MKKENFFGIIMYLFVFAFAVVYGLTVLQTHFQHSSMNQVWQYAIYIILCIIGGVLSSAVLFELGHYVGAKVGGYKVVKFTILYFSIVHENDKRHFAFRRFDGLTGETLIVPNYEKKETPNPYPYLTYGPIFNIAWVVGMFVIFFYFYKGSNFDGDIAYAALTVGLISAILVIYDIVPIKTDTTTNGFLIHYLRKTKDVKAFNDLLESKNGVSDLSSEDDKKSVNKKVVAPTVNINTVEGKIVSLYPLIDDKKYDEANKIIAELYSRKNELTSRQYVEVQEHDIYIKIMTTEYDEMAKIYDEEITLSTKRDISSDHTIIGIRTYILMAGLFDKSRSECALALSKVAKAYKNTLPSRKHPELVLFNDALEKVCQAHPKWELEIYKLYE